MTALAILCVVGAIYFGANSTEIQLKGNTPGWALPAIAITRALVSVALLVLAASLLGWEGL